MTSSPMNWLLRGAATYVCIDMITGIAVAIALLAYLTPYGTDTQQWVKASMKTASVTPPDCKLGKT